MSKKGGFTLIELLAVIAIIGLLSFIVISTLAKHQGKEAKAQADLHDLRNAVELLFDDTGRMPNHISKEPCLQTAEIALDDEAAGIVSNDSVNPFIGWNGPYMPDDPKDPWNRPYYFNSGYRCDGQKGCEDLAVNTYTRAILSFGPDGLSSSDGSNREDDIVLVLCQ